MLNMNSTEVTDAEFEEITTLADEIANPLVDTINGVVTSKYPVGTPDNEALHGLVLGRLVEDYVARYPRGALDFSKLLVGSAFSGAVAALGK